MMEQEYLENEILDKDFIDDYDLDECINISKLLIKKYNRLKNSCPEEVELKITSNYEPIYSCQLPRNNNQMSRVEKHLDDINDYNFMNEKIKNVMNKMNTEERACFAEYFLHCKTENTVAKIMGRSRNGIKPFINSCSVRIALAFHLEVMKGQKSSVDTTREIELVYY